MFLVVPLMLGSMIFFARNHKSGVAGGSNCVYV